MAEGILKQFDYYYGAESDSFNFIQVPKFLFTDPYFQTMKSDSKILYSFMLDRMSLSRKNEWFDEKRRVYIIYTMEEIMESVGCGHTKCVDLLKELTNFGLIERVKRGLGKPDIIYVKDFLHAIEEPLNTDKYTDFRKTEVKTSASNTDFRKTELKTSVNRNSGLPENGTQDIRKSEASNTDLNNTNNIKTDMSYTNPLPLLQQTEDAPSETEEDEEEKVKKQINYDRLIWKHQDNKKLLAYILSQMTEMLSEKKSKTELSSGRYEDTILVKKKLESITFDDIESLLQMLPDKSENNVKNPRGYIRICLFNLVDRRDAICFTRQIKRKGANNGLIHSEYNFEELEKLLL
ncbi:MAG: replication initiator protein A [Lachnospiraceae bacterium]|nr:replication initiator protein A [Lachnospiraceae bacterium]